MRIARVFPTKTNMSPLDEDAYYGEPHLFTPDYDEVHISVTFTWDIFKARRLMRAWEHKGKVRIGGMAIDGESTEPMQEGMYLRKGVTITSRGCPNGCSFCLVRRGIVELDRFPPGNIVQDNNILACSPAHRRKVWQMLRQQRAISFRGGIESARVTDEIVEDLRSLRLLDMWLAFDHPNAEKPLVKAVGKLSRYFKRRHLRCFVLIGYKNDTLDKAEARLKRAWEIGTLPFAMLYKDCNNTKQPKEWRRFQRLWTRPAIFKRIMANEKA